VSFESFGAEVVGLDIGLGIEVAQRFNAARPQVHLVQGNVLMPPFKPDAFDLIFSDGVLQFTPSTEIAFRVLSTCVAPGGSFTYGFILKSARSGKYRSVFFEPLPRAFHPAFCITSVSFQYRFCRL
jgi:SAM-dependent methyltransferase